jgi:hypothetical protein
VSHGGEREWFERGGLRVPQRRSSIGQSRTWRRRHFWRNKSSERLRQSHFLYLEIGTELCVCLFLRYENVSTVGVSGSGVNFPPQKWTLHAGVWNVNFLILSHFFTQ